MKTKPYSQIEENPTTANEPAVAYGNVATAGINVCQVTDAERDSILRAKEQYVRGEYYTESEMDKMVAEYDGYILVETVFDTRQDPEKQPF